MSKFAAYSALAAATVAADDLLLLKDTSATATKKFPLSDLIQGGLLLSTATMIVASKVLSIGNNLATNPVLAVDFNTASVATGLKVTGAAAAGRVAVLVLSSGTDEGLDIDSKGSGTIRVNAVSGTGNFVVGTNLQLGSAKSIVDANGNEIIKSAATVTSAINEITVTNAAAAGTPTIAATGGDTDITLTLSAKGTGNVKIGVGDLQMVTTGAIVDAGGNELIQFPGTVASAVNEITVTNAITTAAPSIAATGGATNISLTLGAKGTGVIQTTSPAVDKRTQTAITDTATITIAQLLTKVLDGTPTGAATYTLPTAALLVAGIANCKVGDSFDFLVNNKAATALTITVASGSGGTDDGTMTVAQNVIRRFTIIVTNVTGSSEAYFTYGQG